MEDTKMRKTMMLAAAVMLAACGSSTAPKGDDSGSDTGSGSDDTACTTAADCGPGMACATDTGACVAAAFTLDKAGFYDDGMRWWTSTDAPTLHGTIDDTAGQSLDAYIAGAKVGSAMVDGTNWMVATQIDIPATGLDNDIIGLFLYRPDGSYVIGCALARSGDVWYASGTASAVPVGPSVVVWMYAEPAAGGIQLVCRFDQGVSYVPAYLSTQPYYPAITGVPGARFHWFDVAR